MENGLFEQRAATPTDLPNRVTITIGSKSHTHRITGVERASDGSWWYTTPLSGGWARKVAPVPVRLFGRSVSLTIPKGPANPRPCVYRFSW